MKKLLGILASGVFLLFSCHSEQGMEYPELSGTLKGVSAKASKATVPVMDFVNNVEAGTATLHRNKNGITINFKATDLIPGHTYTLWWVVWNFPENCAGYPDPCTDADFANAANVEVEVLAATGHVVGGSGMATFSAHLNENDASGSIHGVLRSHGPAIPGMVNEQISTYEGGCTDPFAFPPFTEIPDEEGECGDIYASIHQI
jgi:hypothetical protein